MMFNALAKIQENLKNEELEATSNVGIRIQQLLERFFQLIL